MKMKIGIEGMSCEHCAARVEKALKELEGVKKVKVNLKKKNAELQSDTDLSSEKVKAAVEDAGYQVTDIS